MSGFPPTCFHREPRNLRACTKVPAAVSAALAVLPALTIVDLACDTRLDAPRPCTTSISAAERETRRQRPRFAGACCPRVPSRARSDNHVNRSWARSQSGTRSFARSGQAPLIVSNSWLELFVTDVAARAPVLRGANLRRQDHL